MISRREGVSNTEQRASFVPAGVRNISLKGRDCVSRLSFKTVDHLCCVSSATRFYLLSIMSTFGVGQTAAEDDSKPYITINDVKKRTVQKQIDHVYEAIAKPSEKITNQSQQLVEAENSEPKEGEEEKIETKTKTKTNKQTNSSSIWAVKLVLFLTSILVAASLCYYISKNSETKRAVIVFVEEKFPAVCRVLMPTESKHTERVTAETTDTKDSNSGYEEPRNPQDTNETDQDGMEFLENEEDITSEEENEEDITSEEDPSDSEPAAEKCVVGDGETCIVDSVKDAAGMDNERLQEEKKVSGGDGLSGRLEEEHKFNEGDGLGERPEEENNYNEEDVLSERLQEEHNFSEEDVLSEEEISSDAAEDTEDLSIETEEEREGETTDSDYTKPQITVEEVEDILNSGEDLTGEKHRALFHALGGDSEGARNGDISQMLIL